MVIGDPVSRSASTTSPSNFTSAVGTGPNLTPLAVVFDVMEYIVAVSPELYALQLDHCSEALTR